MSKSDIPDQVWSFMQQRLGYTDEEMETFRNDPRNRDVLATGPTMAQKTIVFEVVSSRGCNAQHKVGERFYFTGDGLMLTRMNPKRVCAFLMPNMTSAIYAIGEMMYAGVDPNEMRFRRSGCFDVGIECGGWGNVVLEVKVLDRDEAAALQARDAQS